MRGKDIGRIIIVAVIFTFFCSGFFLSTHPAAATERPTASEFKDPYGDGVQLAAGGGAPGWAYMSFVNAAYALDFEKMCRLLAPDSEFANCLAEKEMLEVNAKLFTGPEAHNVLGGFMKGDEATLHVAYSWKNVPESRGFVVMKNESGKWLITSFGGSGSSEINVEARGEDDLGQSAGAVKETPSVNEAATGAVQPATTSTETTTAGASSRLKITGEGVSEEAKEQLAASILRNFSIALEPIAGLDTYARVFQSSLYDVTITQKIGDSQASQSFRYLYDGKAFSYVERPTTDQDFPWLLTILRKEFKLTCRPAAQEFQSALDVLYPPDHFSKKDIEFRQEADRWIFIRGKFIDTFKGFILSAAADGTITKVEYSVSIE